MYFPRRFISLLLCCLALFASYAFSQQRADVEEEGQREDLVRRSEYLRTHGLVDTADDLQRRLQVREQLLARKQVRAERTRAMPEAGGGAPGGGNVIPTWKPLGPEPLQNTAAITFSGRISGIAIDPQDPDVIYASVGFGGVWKSLDGGQHWVSKLDGSPIQSVGAVATAPGGQTVYVGTGDPLGDQNLGIGLMKSTDGGESWTVLPQPFKFTAGGSTFSAIGTIVLSPADADIVIVGSTAGVHRSDNGGKTFTKIAQALRGERAQIVFDPAQPSTVFGVWIGTTGNNEIWKSSDAGVTWRKVAMLATGSSAVLTICTSDPAVLYAASGQNSTTLYKSTDHGETWTALSNATLCSRQCSYGIALAVNPANENDVYFGEVNLWHSTDGGNRWTSVFGTNHVDYHYLAFTPSGDRIYAGDDGGMSFRASTDSDVTDWTSLNGTLNTMLIYTGISMKPGDPTTLLGGAQDNGGTSFHDGSWHWIPLGDGFQSAYDATNNIKYLTANFSGLFRITATDPGTFKNSGISPGDQFNGAMAMDQLVPTRLYYSGVSHLYVTSNSGDSFTPILSDAVNTMAVSPVNSDVMYIRGTTCGICVTSNATAGAGAVFSAAATGLPAHTGQRLVAHPLDANTAFLMTATSSGSFNHVISAVFRTTDRGAHWTNISGDLPDVKSYDLAVDPDTDTYYLGTDSGMFFSTNHGVNWQVLGTGLPDARITGVIFDRANQLVRVSSFGRGFWDLYLHGLQVPPQEVDFETQVVNRGDSHTIPLANSSSSTISLEISVSGNFSQTNDCAGSLAPGAQCNVTVSYTPTDANLASGELTIVGDGPDGTHTISMIGKGVDFALNSPRTSRPGRVGAPPASASVSPTNVSPGSIRTPPRVSATKNRSGRARRLQ